MASACGKAFMLSMSCVPRPAAPRMSGQVPTHKVEVCFEWREPVGKDLSFQCRACSARLRRACQDKSRPTSESMFAVASADSKEYKDLDQCYGASDELRGNRQCSQEYVYRLFPQRYYSNRPGSVTVFSRTTSLY